MFMSVGKKSPGRLFWNCRCEKKRWYLNDSHLSSKFCFSSVAFLSFHLSWQQPVFLPWFPQECNAFSSEDKLYKAEKAQQVYVRVCKTGGGEKWGLSPKKSETAAAASPLLHISHQSLLSPNRSKLFSLWSLSFPSSFHLSVYTVLPQLSCKSRLTKIKLFFKGRMLNMPE